MEVRETGFGNENWVYLARDIGQWRALVYTVMNHLFT
jgi:hypothetical protein